MRTSAFRSSMIAAALTAAAALLPSLPCDAQVQPCEPTDTVSECFGSLRSTDERLALSVALLARAGAPGSACGPHDTLIQCFDSTDGLNNALALVNSLKSSASVPSLHVQLADFSLDEKAKLAALPTGPDTAGVSLAGNKKNFLPFLALTGLINEGAGLDDSGTLVLDLNRLVPILGDDVQLKALANTKPKVSAALQEALPEAERGDLITRMESELSDSDDAAVQLTYGLNRELFERRHGRRFEEYEDIFDGLSTAAIGDNVAELVARAPFESDAAKKLAAIELGATNAMRSYHLDSFHKLIDNQPQLLFTAERKLRDSLVGPEELSFKVTYEYGAINLNTFDSANSDCDLFSLNAESETAETCLTRFSEYMSDKEAQIDRGNRFSFSAEYVDVDNDVIDAGVDGIEPLVLAAVTKLLVSVGWSRRFDFGAGEPILLDLVAEYQDVSDDPLRQDRGVATLTLTRNFAGVAVPFGIVYANHGEYLGEVDERLSAHVGLKFNAFGKPKEKKE